jgi:hypothetical protein
VTAPERATAGSVRSAHVAYFLPPDWARVARHAVPALERIAHDAGHVQLLVLVPDPGAAVALARAIGRLDAAADLRVVAATSAPRAQRLLAAGPAHVLIGPPATLASVLASSALKLDQLTTVLFAAADELDAESAELATVMAEVPRDATRVLTALQPTPGVEALLERYLHRARRVTDDVAPAAPAADAPPLPSVRYVTVSGATADALPLVLDEVDAPSATVIAPDARTADAARSVLRAIGYHDDALARVTEAEVPANSALVVTLGVPGATAWSAAVAARPAQIVAIIAARDLAALQLLAGAAVPQPFAARAAVLRARAADARARTELREQLAAGIPTREVLALEPLLGEYDGLEIAAAALRLLERTRAAQGELIGAAESRVRTQMKEAQREKEAREGGRDERPRGFAPRGGERGERPRSGADRGDRPRFGVRGDKPRGDKPRGDKPRGDKPRGPRRDDRSGRPPRNDR